MLTKTFPCEDKCHHCGKPFTRLHFRMIYCDLQTCGIAHDTELSEAKIAHLKRANEASRGSHGGKRQT